VVIHSQTGYAQSRNFVKGTAYQVEHGRTLGITRNNPITDFMLMGLRVQAGTNAIIDIINIVRLYSFSRWIQSKLGPYFMVFR